MNAAATDENWDYAGVAEQAMLRPMNMIKSRWIIPPLLAGVTACTGGVGSTAVTSGNPTPVLSTQPTATPALDVQTVTLSDMLPSPVVTLNVGMTLRVVVRSDFATVTAPQSSAAGVLERQSVQLKGKQAIAVFRATRTGSTTLSAGVTGINPGLMHPVYGAQVNVK